MNSALRAAAAVLALAASFVAAAQDRKVDLQWFGQSCFRITTPGGKVIVIDPFFISNPKTPAALKNVEAMGKVDLILVTHGHGDHFADAPALSKATGAKVYAPAGMASTLVALGIFTAEMAPRFGKGGTIEPFGPGGVKITATHAEHSSELVWKNAQGHEEVHVGGEPVGYVIEMENGFKIYHSGDTGLFGDMKLIGEYYKPDLFLVPIGGHFVMSPVDAAYATNTWIKPKFAIPMHYATIPVLKGTPEEYVKAMGNSPVKVFPISPGDKLTF